MTQCLIEKKCSGCSGIYPPTAEYFRRDRRNKNGLTAYCKECGKKKDKQYRKDNHNACLKRSKEYYRQNKKEMLEKSAEYHKQHRKEAQLYQQYYSNTIAGHLRRIYSGMKRRCNNLKDVSYKNYGGRGIKNKFKSVDGFINYVINNLGINGINQIKGLQIDRINNNGHYEKGNIRFVTCKENSNNRRLKNGGKT